eukprot:3479742-Prymnesium_polylepis.1
MFTKSAEKPSKASTDRSGEPSASREKGGHAPEPAEGSPSKAAGPIGRVRRVLLKAEDSFSSRKSSIATDNESSRRSSRLSGWAMGGGRWSRAESSSSQQEKAEPGRKRFLLSTPAKVGPNSKGVPKGFQQAMECPD